jgi:hypothetical protein
LAFGPGQMGGLAIDANQPGGRAESQQVLRVGAVKGDDAVVRAAVQNGWIHLNVSGKPNPAKNSHATSTLHDPCFFSIIPNPLIP